MSLRTCLKIQTNWLSINNELMFIQKSHILLFASHFLRGVVLILCIYSLACDFHKIFSYYYMRCAIIKKCYEFSNQNSEDPFLVYF